MSYFLSFRNIDKMFMGTFFSFAIRFPYMTLRIGRRSFLFEQFKRSFFKVTMINTQTHDLTVALFQTL